ncbi:MAG TPA: recombinase RecA [Phycisphaerae bacterium]|nr:recombinase RecA [Phycisphaerae bacterium]
MAKKKKSEKGAVEYIEGAKERRATLERVVAQIEKQYGKGALMTLSPERQADVPCIPTGSLSLDIALGGRGLPRGRVAEFYGPEASGKTTLALSVIANAQRAGGVAAFIDAEHAFDAAWAKRIGVDLEALLVSQPDTGEQALEICDLLVRSGAVDIVVIDSVAALVPRAEIEGEMGDTHMGLQARLMSQALRKLTGSISKSRTAVIFLNQIREKIGIMFGNPETTPGGRALKFYASTRIDLRRIQAIKSGERVVGSRTRAKVVKNKVAPPYQSAEFEILFDRGISYEGDLLDLAVEAGVVEKQGAWISCGEVRLGQGRESARTFLEENADLAAELREKVIAAKGVAAAGGAAAKTEAESADDAEPEAPEGE